jgi:hypothetical protein
LATIDEYAVQCACELGGNRGSALRQQIDLTVKFHHVLDDALLDWFDLQANVPDAFGTEPQGTEDKERGQDVASGRHDAVARE